MKNENPSLILTSSHIAYNSESDIVADNRRNFYVYDSVGNLPIGGGYFELDYCFLRKVGALRNKVFQR